MAGLDLDTRNILDPETEQLVIGTVLQTGNECFESIASLLRREHFATRRNEIIWAAIERIAPEVLIGTDSVFHYLTEQGTVEQVGGLIGLLDIHDHGIQGLPLIGFARTLVRKFRRRRQLHLVELISTTIQSGQDPSRQALDELAQLATPSDGFVIERLPAVSAEQSPILYAIDVVLPEAAVTAFTGNSGCGKSTLATALMRDVIATGRSSLMLDRESPRPVVLDRMNRLGLSDGPLLRWAGGWLDEGVPGPDCQLILDWVRRCNPKPLIVIDSLSAFMDGDENSANEMRSFMQGPRRLADRGAAVLILHHDGKSETARDFRGSSDFKASVDQAFHVTNVSSDQHLDGLRLRVYKSRYGLIDDITFRYANGAMVRDIRPNSAKRTQAQELIELLRANPDIGQKQFEDLAVKRNLGRNQARIFLDDSVNAGVVDRQRGTHNRYKHRLLEALE